jgi:hypothetical protein
MYRWLQKGVVPGVLIDTTWIIYRDEVKDYLLSNHNQAGARGVELGQGQDEEDPE